MKEQIERYRKLYAGVIYDAMRFDFGLMEPFVVDRTIAHTAGPREPMVGPAFTVTGRQYRRSHECAVEAVAEAVAESAAALDTRHLRMYKSVTHGDVLVMDTGGDQLAAHFGDVSALMAKQAGAVGCVIDGYTRDVRQIEQMGFPLFSRGATPQDAIGDWGVTHYRAPLSLPGTAGLVCVCPGDLVFADQDGVLVIPSSMVGVVLAAAELRAATETLIRTAIRAGEPPEDVFGRLGKW